MLLQDQTWKNLEHKISLKIFAQKCANDELGLTLIFL